VPESHRDAGLIRVVGAGTLAASIVNTVIGAGIFRVPAALAANVGVYAPAAFLLCGLAIGAVAICFAEGGSRMPTSGGVYGYIDAAFGPLVGYVAGTLLWLGNALACGGIAAALGDTAASAVPPALAMATYALAVVAVVGAIAVVNVSGVSRGARLINVATVVKLVPLLVFVTAGAFAVHGLNLTPTPRPGSQGLGRALILALFAFTGMEGALSASGEVAQPAKTIPRALSIAMLSTIVLYVAVQTVAQGILGARLAHSPTPLADAMAQIHPALGTLMLAGATLSMLGWIGSDMLGSPRILFAIARDGHLPRALGRTHRRSHTPHIAILCYAALAIGLALTGTFAELAVLATLASAALYIVGCMAAWRLARRGVALAGEPLNFRWLGTSMAVGTASMVALIALASTTEIIGLAAVVGVSGATYLVQSQRF
jgi:APA family basic amino acid/polyamine antiporter